MNNTRGKKRAKQIYRLKRSRAKRQTQKSLFPFVKGSDNSQISFLILKAGSHVIIIISQYF